MQTPFASLSEAKRVLTQRAIRVPMCAYMSIPDGMPYRVAAMITCNKPALAQGRHGFLCKEHLAMEEQGFYARRRVNYTAPDPDDAVVLSIMASEARAIERGKVDTVRFGALEPVYMKFWEPKGN